MSGCFIEVLAGAFQNDPCQYVLKNRTRCQSYSIPRLKIRFGFRGRSGSREVGLISGTGSQMTMGCDAIPPLSAKTSLQRFRPYGRLMKDNLLSRGRYKGCDENGPAAALLLSHVSIQICSFVAPCRRPILIATPLPQSLTWCTSPQVSVI